MKEYLFCILFVGIASFGSSQCVKKYRMVCEKGLEVNADGSEGKESPLNATITLSKDSIIMVLNFPNEEVGMLKGALKETVCKMNADYSEGIIEYKCDAEITRVPGDIVHEKMIFRLESKGGKFKLYYGLVDKPDERGYFVIKDKTEIAANNQ